MRILIVNRYMSLLGGAENVVKEFSTRLLKRRIDARVVSLNCSDEVRAACAGVLIATPREKFDYTFRSAGIVSTAGIIRELRSLRRLTLEHSKDVDLVNAHNFPASWVCSRLGKPVVWMCNEVPDFYNNPRPSPLVKLLRCVGIRVDRAIVRRDIGTICVADEYNRRVVERRYGMPADIVAYGIEYDFFSRPGKDSEETRREYGLNKRFVVAHTGMISPQKDQMSTLAALAALKDEMPDMVVVFAGRPQEPYNGMLKEYAHTKGLSERVIFTGHVSKEAVRDLYHCADAAVFPVKTQGGWLSPFEALSAGVPVVVSPSMGAASILTREGLADASDDLVVSLRLLRSRGNENRARVLRAQEWIRRNLTWDRFTDKMLEIFERELYNKKIR
jgi:glycosyltransferase involved in cell wall biosynthesis